MKIFMAIILGTFLLLGCSKNPYEKSITAIVKNSEDSWNVIGNVNYLPSGQIKFLANRGCGCGSSPKPDSVIIGGSYTIIPVMRKK
jgi:hypothetical protein